MEQNELETMTISSTGALERRLEGRQQTEEVTEDEGEEESWPGLTATRKDIHQGPPTKQGLSSNTKLNDDNTIGMIEAAGETEGVTRRGGTAERQAVSCGKVPVLRHDLETTGREASLESDSVIGYQDCSGESRDPATEEPRTFRVTPKAQMLSFPQFAATGEEAIVSSFRRARSFVEKGNRSAARDIDQAHMETTQNSGLRRQVENRRSYNTQRTTDSSSQFRSVGRGGYDLSSPFTVEGTSGEGGKGLTGLNQAEITDVNAFKAPTGSTRRRPLRATHRFFTESNNQRSMAGGEFGSTPPVTVPAPQGPPPPTPATGLRDNVQGMTDGAVFEGVDYPEGQTVRPSRDRSGWKSAKRSPVEAAMDQGVSNTSQILLETKLTKQILSFPEISVEEQRQALGSPRLERPLLPRRRPSSSRSPTKSPNRQPKRSHSKERNDRTKSRERLPTLDGGLSQSSLNLAAFDTPSTGKFSDPTVSEQISPLTRRRNKDISGSILSLTSESSKKTATTLSNTRDRYSKMIALGLPRVNLDIEKNHFSRHSLKKRSQKLRERFDVPGEDGSVVGPGIGARSEPPPHEAMETSESVHMAPSQPPPSLCKSMVGTNDDDNDAMWPGEGGDVESVILKTYEPHQLNPLQLNGSSLQHGEPPLTSVPKDFAPSGEERTGFQRQTTVRRGKNKSVNYTYFRMMPPGQNKCSPANSAIETPRSSKVLYQSAA